MRTYVCLRCGDPYENDREKKNRLCYPCGIKQMTEEIRQLQVRKGPYYDRWKLGMERAKRDRKARKRSLRST